MRGHGNQPATSAEMPLRPGSREAGEHGCTCPVIDNAGGKGYLGGIVDPKNGNTIYVMNDACPLHKEFCERNLADDS